jgi:hypothetical protein
MALPPGFVPPFLEGETKIESPPWLPAHWHAVERPRDTSAHADRFYYTPDCSVRLRSKPCVPRAPSGLSPAAAREATRDCCRLRARLAHRASRRHDVLLTCRARSEVERYLAGKPTLESLAKGAPRLPPVPPACPVEEVRASSRA